MPMSTSENLTSTSDFESTNRTVIVGGGIAGLTLALTLAKHGVASVVLEARTRLSEAGAGIQLGPNATHILRDLGVLDDLKLSAVAPEAIVVADAATGREITELPLGAWMEQRHGAPYLVTHRADLQAALLAQVAAHSAIDLRLGWQLKQLCSDQRETAGIAGTPANPAILDITERGAISTPLVVGADGVWSALRFALVASQGEGHTTHRMSGKVSHLTYSGMTAARTTLKSDDLPAHLRRLATHVWMAPNAHLVMYPIRSGGDVALVAITAAPEPEQGWGVAVDRDTFLAGFKALNQNVAAVLDRAGSWKRWALFNPLPLKTWSRDRLILIGDAAHPILPFLAQGGAMAIEDGYVLGRLIAAHGPDPQRVFPAFEKQRCQRVGQVQRASRENGRIYHLDGLAAKGRNFAMRATPSRLLMQRYDWIYNWSFEAGQ